MGEAFVNASAIPVVCDDGRARNPLEEYVRGRGLVAYHGTSSAYSQSIEINGLSADHMPVRAEDCARVVSAYERLQWFGWRHDPNVGSGISVLAPWGPSRDIKITGHRHLYLAETFARATVFANFPGGETVCALKHCIEQLFEFSERAYLRDAHLQDLAAELEELSDLVHDTGRGPSGVAPSLPRIEQLRRAVEDTRQFRWLDDERERLRTVLKHLHGIVARHEPVVYAARVEAEVSTPGGKIAVSEFVGRSTMGIEVTEPIPASRLLAKAIRVKARTEQ